LWQINKPINDNDFQLYLLQNRLKLNLKSSNRNRSVTMTYSPLWAGALSLVLIHAETGCQHAAQQAAKLLAHLADEEGMESETRALCERASERLRNQPIIAQHHV
jgi:hypothetical protein